MSLKIFLSQLLVLSIWIFKVSAEPGILVKHSQTRSVPSCEPGHVKLWEGYSLLYTESNGNVHSQDLGSSGSCLKKFSTLPFVSCDTNNACHYATRNEQSYWLATAEAVILTATIQESDVAKYISRCVVCGTPKNVLVLHSQSSSIPDCPAGWSGIWTGSSLLLHSGAGSKGNGQSLASTGSCLPEFRSTPFIECNGALGNCYFYNNDFHSWLYAIADDQQFQKPRKEILRYQVAISPKISRCQVCQND